jgi:uncharacterized protein (DUF58 family)
MAVSGWFVALLALGIVPVVLLDDPAALWAWLVFVLVLASIDAAIAASPRRIALERALPGPVRLGETVDSTLYLTNPGSRRLRAVVRDGWPPSAGAAPTRQAVEVPAGERRAITTLLTPFRRGAPGLHRRARIDQRAAAVHLPQAPALAPRTLARARRRDERHGAWPRHGVRQPARLRAR